MFFLFVLFLLECVWFSCCVIVVFWGGLLCFVLCVCEIGLGVVIVCYFLICIVRVCYLSVCSCFLLFLMKIIVYPAILVSFVSCWFSLCFSFLFLVLVFFGLCLSSVSRCSSDLFFCLLSCFVLNHAIRISYCLHLDFLFLSSLEFCIS